MNHSQRVGNILIVADPETELAQAVIDVTNKGVVIVGMDNFAQSCKKFDESLKITKQAVFELSESIPPKEYTPNPHRAKSGKIRRR